MTTWIKSHDALRDHPKLKRLCRLASIDTPTAIGYLHMFWWWCMKYAPDGDLSRFDDEDIDDGVEWSGESSFITLAMAAGFVDSDRTVHDWSDYGEALLRRREVNAERMRNARAEHVQSTCETRVGLEESREEKSRKRKIKSVVEPKPAARPRAPSFKEEIAEVFAYWQEVMGKQSATLTPQRRDKIRVRLQGGYTVDKLKAAIDGCRASPHNMGDNDRARPFNDLELILRNETNVEKFLELAPAHRSNGGRTWTADDRATIEEAVKLAREGRDADAQALCGNDSMWQEVVRRVEVMG